ncbi:uncharacterized protein LOC141898830 [Tubulanus polymorphus]|uniref:uncharacterized protein LOC141898830 n=1 Tax=Tubulanus polymorphus TaxID=672921 RepID=UPI003DA2ED7E
MAQKSENSPTLLWLGSSVYLKDYRANYNTPNIVKVTKGEYLHLGTKDEANSSNPNRQDEAYLHKVQRISKVLAVNMKHSHDAMKIVQTNQKLAIPVSYRGWFEALSEEGRQIRPIRSITELIRVSPHTCLVREDIRGYTCKDNGEISLDHYRIVKAGETLTLFGVINATANKQKQTTQIRFLRCLDENGQTVQFSAEQKGTFSPVAARNISGVHNIKSIISNFRLPVTVHLAYGPRPRTGDKIKFSGIVRLLYVYDEEIAFTCSLTGNERMLPIPTHVPLKILPSANFEEIKNSPEMRQVNTRCGKMAQSYLNSIHVLYDVAVDLPEEAPKQNHPAIRQPQSPQPPEPEIPDKVTQLPKDEEDQLFDEVEDIYLYVVRYGIKPPEGLVKRHNWSEHDNWEEPIYQTLHKKPKNKDKDQPQKLQKSMESGGHNKVFRFHRPKQDTAEPVCTVIHMSKEEKFDQVDSLGDIPLMIPQQPPPLPARKYERSHSVGDIVEPSPLDRKQKPNADVSRRKSNPAIFRIFGAKKKTKLKTIKASSHDSSDGSSSPQSPGGSGDSDEKVQKVRRNSRVNMYL